MIDFRNLAYLSEGSVRQRAAYTAINNVGIFEKLKAYSPFLAGTIPIQVDVETSDLDIICSIKDRTDFKAELVQFSNLDRFTLRELIIDRIPTIIANFHAEGFEFEIFAQDIPVEQQNGYLHMLIEYLVLSTEGADFKAKVIELKKNGYKTEPAFAKLLGLEGDPYQALLHYKK